MIIIGLGTNIGDKLQNLRNAISEIKKNEFINIHDISPVYFSNALLPENYIKSWDKNFFNCAISCSTKLSIKDFFNIIKKIESKMGRQNIHEKWSPRIIDIDILSWNNIKYSDGELQIPHVSLYERPFALWPLSDLMTNWEFYLPKNSCKSNFYNWGSKFEKNKDYFNTVQTLYNLKSPVIVGILNLTPDSFSDGGEFNNIEKSVKQFDFLIKTGAEIIDIGAESTRPGAETISHQKEWNRLKPILESINKNITKYNNEFIQPKISVDTRNYQTAEKTIELCSPYIINDVSGGYSSNMLDCIKNSKSKLIFMHSLTIPANKLILMKKNCDIIKSLINWGIKKINYLQDHGINKDKLIFDPGIGFGKSQIQSINIIKNIKKFKKLDVEIMIGHSRKSFLKEITPNKLIKKDLETSIISSYLENTKTTNYLRVHDVFSSIIAIKINQIFKK